MMGENEKKRKGKGRIFILCKGDSFQVVLSKPRATSIYN